MKDAMWEQYCGNEVDVCNSHHSSLHLIGDSVLAQDQAGEFGARRIYKGQMDVFGRHTALGKLIEVRTVFALVWMILLVHSNFVPVTEWHHV